MSTRLRRARRPRSIWLALAAGALALAAWSAAGRTQAQTAPPEAGPLDTLRLITFTPPLVFSVAQERGFFAAEGLRVEHTLTTSPETEQALALGYRVLGRSLDHLPQYPAPQGGTTRRWAAANEDKLVRFIRAYVAATDWALSPANREDAIAMHQRAWDLERAAAESDYATAQPEATINIAGIQTVIDLRAALGFLQPPIPPAAQFYDTRYWEQATGRQHP